MEAIYKQLAGKTGKNRGTKSKVPGSAEKGEMAVSHQKKERKEKYPEKT